MNKFTMLSPATQIAEHLRGEVRRGTWLGEMPGTPQLAAELAVDRRVITDALCQLEEEGLVVNQGVGRPRKIKLPKHFAPPSLRVAILKQNILDRDPILINLRHGIEEAGFGVFEADKSLLDLKMAPKRIARYVKRNPADAWVVVGGSREALEWFAAQPIPAFALVGQYVDVPIAASGPLIGSSLGTATRRLIEIGHRRISMLVRKHHRHPKPSRTIHGFLDELAASGIAPGSFNLPDWEESADGLRNILDSLFSYTPPTALIPNESFLFNAVYHYLSDRGLRVPGDVSLISTEFDRNHVWCRPSVAHIRWDYDFALRHVVRWALNVARGKDDRRQAAIKAEFVDGDTVGPAPAA